MECDKLLDTCTDIPTKKQAQARETHQHGIVYPTSNGSAGGHHIAEGQDPQGTGAKEDNHDEGEGSQVHPPELLRGLLFRLLRCLGIFVIACIGSGGTVIDATRSTSAGDGGVLPSSDRHLDEDEDFVPLHATCTINKINCKINNAEAES